MMNTNMKALALARIRTLFLEAHKAFKEDFKLADRYVLIARKLAMKHKVRMPSELKRRFCKHCYSYLMPGQNCRIRLQKSRVVYYCFKCKKYMRFGVEKR